MGSSHAKALRCPDSHPVDIASLCYKKCPAGMEHIPGAPTFCRPSVGNLPISYTPPDDPGVPMTCSKGKVQSGALCYDDPGPGWRVVAGVAYKDCPAGSKDIGALCIPGGGSAPPWYLSFYILIAVCLVIVVCIIYWRVRSVYAAITGSGRRFGIKKGRN
jgi:hypothetical protein